MTDRYVAISFGLLVAIWPVVGHAADETGSALAVPGLSDNPAADAVSINEHDCPGGRLSIEPGFVRRIDVDGDDLDDVVLNFVGLRCDGVPYYCGTGGCWQEIWLADREGPYRRLLSELVVRVELPAPGMLHVVMDGGNCGLSGAEVCEYEYLVQNGALVPAE